MDIFKSKGRFAQGGTKHINKPTTHQERTHQHGAPFLFVCTSEREKENNKDHKDTRTNKAGKRTSKAGKQAKKKKNSCKTKK